MRTELYRGLEEGFLPNMLPLIDVLFHVALAVHQVFIHSVYL